MKYAGRIVLHGLTLLSLILFLLTAVLWLRSPAIFDRLSRTDSTGRLWELTSLWGDLALARMDACPVAVPTRWQVFRIDASGSEVFRPLADCMLFRHEELDHTDFPGWGRGFSRERGVTSVAPYSEDSQGKLFISELRFFDVAYTRWTIPLWLPFLIFSLLPAMRLATTFCRWKSSIPAPIPSTSLLRRLTRAIPSFFFLAVLLFWWRGFWVMDRIGWNARHSGQYLSACRGFIVFEIGPTFERQFLESMRRAEEQAVPPTTLPYDDILRSPDWNHTFRRSERNLGPFLIGRFSFEPDPWDLSRLDIPITFDLELDLRNVNRLGFHLDTSQVPIVIIPFWPLALLAGLLPLRQILRARRRRLRFRSSQCVKCGYDLRATPDRCPECGQPRFSSPSFAKQSSSTTLPPIKCS